MAASQNDWFQSVAAGADLSADANNYGRAVKLNAGQAVIATSGRPIGLLQNLPKSGQATLIQSVWGTSCPARAVGTITKDDLITLDSTGGWKTAAAGNAVYGQAMEACGDGALFRMFWGPQVAVPGS